MSTTQTIEVVISGRDNFSATANKVLGSLKNLEGAAGRLTTKIGRDLSNGIGNAVKNTERLALAAGGLAAGAGAAAVKWAGDFQAQMNTINTIAFATPEALEKIGDGIRGIAKDTGLSLDDLTASYYDLLSAGIKTADAQSVLNDAVKLGIGGLATTAQTVDLLTTAYNAYGLDAAGAAKATDMFAQAVADGKVKASEIAETFSNVASVAKAYGIGIDQIAASYGFLTAQGVAASEVTTEMQRAIISLIKPLPALEEAQKKLKVNFTDEIRKKGLIPALQELREYSDKTKIPLIELLGRVEAVKFVLQTTGSQEKGFLGELDKVNSSTGMAAKQAAERQQGFNYELARFKALVHDAGITIGNSLLPQLTSLVSEADDFINNNQGGIKKFGTDLAGALRDVVSWVRKLDFQAIGNQLRFAGQMAKGIVDVFLNLPGPIQSLLTGLFVANKFTGGAVQSIIGDLASGLIKGVLGITAGVVNINAGAVNSGLSGVVGGGSLLGKAASIASKVVIVGVVAEAAMEISKALGLGYNPDPSKQVPGDQLSWPWGPKNTPKLDLFGFQNVLGGDSPYGPGPTGGASGVGQGLAGGLSGAAGMFNVGGRAARSLDTGSERVGIMQVSALQANTAALNKLTAHEKAKEAVGGKGKSFHDFLLGLRGNNVALAIKDFPKELAYLSTVSDEQKKNPIYQRGLRENIAALKRDMVHATTAQKLKLSADIKALQTLLSGTLTVHDPQTAAILVSMGGWGSPESQKKHKHPPARHPIGPPAGTGSAVYDGLTPENRG